MNQQIERRVQKVDLDFLIKKHLEDIGREEKCMYHKTEDGLTKPWLLSAANYCKECGKNLRGIET
jgi:hypothetical protein